MVDRPRDEGQHLPVPPTQGGMQAYAGHLPSRGLGTESEPSADWRRYVAAVLRRKWLVLALAVVGLAAGVGAARFARPVYETEATVWINRAPRGESDPIQQAQLLESFGWIELLTSFVVLDDAVRSLKLYVHHQPRDSALFRTFELGERFARGRYELRVSPSGDSVILAGEGDVVVERLALGDSVGRAVGFRWMPPPELLSPGRGVVFSVNSPRDEARWIADSLSPSMARDGSFLRVRMSGFDPYRITATVNTVVHKFVEVAAELKRSKLTEKANFLEEQLSIAERNLRGAEQELRDFQVRTITLPSQRASPIAPGLELTQDPVFKNFFDRQLELDALRRDRESILRALAQAEESAVAVEAFEAIGAARSSSELAQALFELTNKRAELRALRFRYTDSYGPVRRLNEQIGEIEQRVIPSLSRALIAELTAREGELLRMIDLASEEMQQIPPRRIREAGLSRDVDIAEALYTNLQQRYEEARLAELSTIPDVRVLDEAIVPPRPSRSRAQQFWVLGFLGGFGIGVIGAVLLDQMDRRVHYPDQVTDEMGLPILGVVPYIRNASNGRRSPDSAPVVEALRGIRLNLLHAYGSAGPVVLTVTSPSVGDGKSFIASNLALAFADAGHRTLLIDGDSRRGSLHRVLSASRKPGLTDCLTGRAKPDEVPQQTEYPQLDFLGGGTRTAGAPELLGSRKMIELLTDLRHKYDVIIIDSPPLGAGVDAFTLGTVTGNMLIVLKTGATDRDEAEARLDVLDRLPIRVLGAVLNGVRDQKAYGYKYYSYYMPGYEHEMEPEERLLKGTG